MGFTFCLGNFGSSYTYIFYFLVIFLDNFAPKSRNHLRRHFSRSELCDHLSRDWLTLSLELQIFPHILQLNSYTADERICTNWSKLKHLNTFLRESISDKNKKYLAKIVPFYCKISQKIKSRLKYLQQVCTYNS